MRKLGYENRIQGLSLPEVHAALEIAAVEYAHGGLTFLGRKVKTGPVLNAIVLHFLSLPAAERYEAVRCGLSELERLIASDSPLAIKPPVGRGLIARREMGGDGPKPRPKPRPGPKPRPKPRPGPKRAKKPGGSGG